MLTKLDQARAAAFARPGDSPLAAADARATSAYRYDATAVASLRSRGAHAVGLRMVLDRVIATAGTGRQVTLTVTDRRLPYEIRDSRDQLISRVAGRGAAQHLIKLRDIAPGGGTARQQWRVAEVSEPPERGS